jgi:hypothetical protein
LAIGCPTKIVPMFLEELDVQNIITILNCQTSFLCLRTINEIKTISMHKTCMKFFNLKCHAIIEISYGQTLQLCAYNFTFRSPIFPMFVNVIMQIWVMSSLQVLFCIPTIIYLFLKRMTSQDFHHKNKNSQSPLSDDTYYAPCNLHILLFLCTLTSMCWSSCATHGLGSQKVNPRKKKNASFQT